jgi:hypothetical protein
MAAIVLFILPIETRSELGEDGWVFESKRFVPDSAIQKLISFFNAPLKEEFLGIRKYQNEFA